MTAMDCWKYTARCPSCAATGIVNVEELDGWSFVSAGRDGKQFRWIHWPPEGFVVYSDERGNDAVKCAACDVKIGPGTLL
jgi:hypothetical protein